MKKVLDYDEDLCLSATVLWSRSRLEPPLLGRVRSRNRFLFWSEPGAGAAILKAAPAASFRQATKEKPCSCVKHDRAV